MSLWNIRLFVSATGNKEWVLWHERDGLAKPTAVIADAEWELLARERARQLIGTLARERAAEDFRRATGDHSFDHGV